MLSPAATVASLETSSELPLGLQANVLLQRDRKGGTTSRKPQVFFAMYHEGFGHFSLVALTPCCLHGPDTRFSHSEPNHICACATNASLIHTLCLPPSHASSSSPAWPQPPSSPARSAMVFLWASSLSHVLAASGWEQHYLPHGHLVPHGGEHKLFLYLQGEVTHTTKGFCSFPKASPPPDNPKSKGLPAERQLLQTPCVQTKRCWDPGKLENLMPRVRDGAWLPGRCGVFCRCWSA